MAFGLSAGAIAGIGAVGGALIGANASRSAANTQADAAREANATSQAQYDQTRADLAPWRAAGGVALGQLGTGTADGAEFNRNFTLSDFNKDPGYQFRMDQGQQAMERSAAARGGALGGGALKGLQRYAQDYASGEYGNAYNRFNTDTTNRFNRLSSIAGIGQTANAQVGAAGAQNAATIGSNQLAMGNAQAAGRIGQANAINNGIGNMQSMYTLNNLLGNKSTGANIWAPGYGSGSDGGWTGNH